MSDYIFKMLKMFYHVECRETILNLCLNILARFCLPFLVQQEAMKIMLLLELVCQKVTEFCALFGTDSTKFVQPTANN